METRGLQKAAWPVDRYGNTLYVLSLAVIAIAGSLVAILAAEHRFVTPEAWIATGILWAFAIPAFVVLSILSWPVYRRYRRATGAIATVAIYSGNLLAVIIGGVAFAYALVALLGRLQ
jgi:hypothetical protein